MMLKKINPTINKLSTTVGSSPVEEVELLMSNITHIIIIIHRSTLIQVETRIKKAREWEVPRAWTGVEMKCHLHNQKSIKK